MPKLRIKNAERITLCVPFTPRCQIWNALLVKNWQVVEIIRLTTDSPGLTGYGETLPHYTWGRVSDANLERVQGQDPADFLGDDSLGAGLQMAVYDLVGKALDAPVHKLLNLPRLREWCPIGWWNSKMPPEALAEEAKDALAQGYTCHKFKVRPWIDVYAQIEAVSAVTPPYYRLDVDWNNMLLDAGNAIPVLTALDAYERVAIYEGVIPPQDTAGHRQIRSHIKHPLAIHWGDPPFPLAIREDICDGFVIGGGVSAVLRNSILAGAFHKLFWLQMVGTGLVTALCAHLGAVLPNAQWPAITCLNNYTNDLLVEPLTIKGGYLKVPDGPGLGVTVDEEALERYRMAPPYVLPEDKWILSVVWPGGRMAHFANMQQCWRDFLAGNHPVQVRGVRMDVRRDDGSKEWRDLHARVTRAPVWEG